MVAYRLAYLGPNLTLSIQCGTSHFILFLKLTTVMIWSNGSNISVFTLYDDAQSVLIHVNIALLLTHMYILILCCSNVYCVVFSGISCIASCH